MTSHSQTQLSTSKLHGLFLNTPKANCSIYESGLMAYQCLTLSNKYQLDYREIDAASREIPRSYDFYVFNYHYAVMNWLDTSCVGELPGLKATVVLETLPDNPLVLSPKRDFDAYLVLDPGAKVTDRRIYAMPRPLEPRPEALPPLPDIPTIGTFGLATPGKGFELVVDAVCREFDEAIVRINMSPGTHTDGAAWLFYRRDYAEYLTELCIRVARNKVSVVVTRDYMAKKELIQWCAENTLNCFLYNRNQSGLAATTDQAISSGRPLAVSTNETFRHIHPYIAPYPFQSLRESIASSQPQVLKMREDWSPKKFVDRFHDVLIDGGLMERPTKPIQVRGDDAQAGTFELRLATPSANNRPTIPANMKVWNTNIRSRLRLRTRARRLLRLPQPFAQTLPPELAYGDAGVLVASSSKPMTQLDVVQSQSTMSISDDSCRAPILIVNHKEQHCGIHEYGVNIAEALAKSKRYAFLYAECASAEELDQEVRQRHPVAIIYNHHTPTMPWLTSDTTRRYRVPQLGTMHEVTQETADNATRDLFDYYLCPDPTLVERNPYVIRTLRLIPPYLNYKFFPKVPTFGTFGFASDDKGFERVIHVVQQEFDRAIIRINVPFNDFVPDRRQRDVIARIEFSRQQLVKPDIEVVVTHEFFQKKEMLDFLAGNSMNLFLYNPRKDLGVSSTLEHALAVQRPMAITKCNMFRHMFKASPSICIEDQSLSEILDNGVAPLVPFYNEWSEGNFILSYESILDRVLQKTETRTLDAGAPKANNKRNHSLNRILDDSSRAFYKPVIQELFTLAPEMMSRKIPQANVQQAFVLDTVRKFAQRFETPKILCVGSYDDTAATGLKSLGYVVEEIDPAINFDLNTFFQQPSTLKESYDIIFSTSVLEHVSDDELFVTQIGELLAPGGVGVLTCDYNDQYRPGDAIPKEDIRFYTQRDLRHRLLPALKNCALVDEPQWDCSHPDFAYAGRYRYTFASIVVQKRQYDPKQETSVTSVVTTRTAGLR